LATLKESDPASATEASVVARTLINLHGKLNGQEEAAAAAAVEDKAEEKVPAMWKRMLIVPGCICIERDL